MRNVSNVVFTLCIFSDHNKNIDLEWEVMDKNEDGISAMQHGSSLPKNFLNSKKRQAK